jgi:hypothetical protein
MGLLTLETHILAEAVVAVTTLEVVVAQAVVAMEMAAQAADVNHKVMQVIMVVVAVLEDLKALTQTMVAMDIKV